MARLHLSVGACLQAIACHATIPKIAHRVGSYKPSQAKPSQDKTRQDKPSQDKPSQAMIHQNQSPDFCGSQPAGDVFVVGAHPVGDFTHSAIARQRPAND